MPLIPLDRIVPDPRNARVTPATPEQDADLLASVKAQGVIQPIVVRTIVGAVHDRGGKGGRRPGTAGRRVAAGFMVVVGHRRFAAAKLAGLESVRAEVRDGLTEAEVRLMQLAENERRAPMSPLDAWAAVEAAAAAGAADPAIALALNRPERQVRQLRAMGRLHGDLKARIRETGRFPDDRQLRAICQAPPDQQAKALADALERGQQGYDLWHSVAVALAVRRIPLAHARFDRAAYTGPVHGDLFAAEEESEQAEDVERFRALQLAWMRDECRRRLGQGFAGAVVLEREQYGGWKAPAAAEKYDHGREVPAKLPSKAERAASIYGVGLEDSGRVTERLFRRKRAAGAEGGAPAAPGGALPKPADPLREAFTGKGVDALEKAKRLALAEALDAGTPIARDPDTIIMLLAALLREHAKHRFGSAAPPSYAHLLGDDGRIGIDGRAGEVVGYGRALAAHMLGNREDVALETAERIGDWLGVAPAYPADPDSLGMVKGPGVEAVAKALGVAGGGAQRPTRQALRRAIGARLAAIGPEHLPAVGWKVAPKPRAVGDFGADDDDGDEEWGDGGPGRLDDDSGPGPAAGWAPPDDPEDAEAGA